SKSPATLKQSYFTDHYCSQHTRRSAMRLFVRSAKSQHEPAAFVPTFDDDEDEEDWDDFDYLERNGEAPPFDDDVEPDDEPLDDIDEDYDDEDDDDFDDDGDDDQWEYDEPDYPDE